MSAVHEQALDALRQVRRQSRRRRAVLLGALTVSVLAAGLGRALLGDFQISLVDAGRILGGAQIPGASFILLEVKLPRTLLGALTGAAFGLGGALFQTLLRNPLASPDVIGISMGASASAVLALVVLGLDGDPVAVAAVAGALVTAALVRLASRDGTGQTLVVTGVVVNMVLTAVVQYLLTRAAIHEAQAALVWLTGSVSGAGWRSVRVLALALALLIPPIAFGWRSLAARELGEDSAVSLGVPRGAVDLMLALATVCVAVAVAAAGPIAFVAFMSGPLARMLSGGRTDPVAAAAIGALLVLLADFAGGELIGDLNLPAGVVTGACGAPFLLYLLVRSTGGRR